MLSYLPNYSSLLLIGSSASRTSFTKFQNDPMMKGFADELWIFNVAFRSIDSRTSHYDH